MDPTRDALCPGCFAPKGHANPCPHCGYDERAERSPLLLPHSTLLNGQFIVGRVLGKPGGFGITYLGWDLNLETRVAIKEYLPRELAGRAGDHTNVAPHSAEEGEQFRYGLEQFLREARTLAQLDHPNIVRVRQFFEANGTAYLVMDYYQGFSLGEHLERQGGRLPEDIAKRLMLPVLDGLRAVHAKGFLHRDIKPENIYLARTGSGGVRPILLDFGAARQAMSERSRSLSVVVSAGYAPFEQYQRRGNQGPWTDVYSAAAVLYRLVTGEPPPEAIERVSGDEIKPAASFGVSKRLSDALDTALALAPEVRPQTVPEFQGRLWGARPPQEADPAPTSPIPSSAPTPEHRSVQSAPPASPETEKGSASAAGSGLPSHRWLWPAVLAVVVVLLGLGALYQYRQSPMTTGLGQDAAEENAFSEALAQNTETAYRAYLSGCGADGCRHRAEAEQRLQDLAVETAPTTETASPGGPMDGARETETVPPAPKPDLNALLQTCQQHFGAQRYTVGKEGTALACYREVLRLDSGNAEALSALVRMEEQYHRWATDALARGDLDKTTSYILRMRQLNPSSAAATQIEIALVSAKSALDKRVSPSHGAAGVPKKLLDQLPGVQWDARVVTLDGDCDGHDDRAYLGRAKGHVFVGFVSSAGSTVAFLEFSVSASVQDAICNEPAELESESLDYDPTEAVGKINGFVRSKTCKGLLLSGGECDPIHVFWNRKTKLLNWWRL